MPSSSSPFSCVLIGSDSLLIQCGEILLQRRHAVRGVVSRERAILEWARGKQIPTFPTSARMADDLRGLEFDYLFSITNLSIIPEEVLELPERAAINFHDGPLPRYAGMYAPAWALLNGETEYGISFHAMSGGIDEGDLYAQQLFPIGPEETSLTLNTRCFESAIETFGGLVDALGNGQARPVPQDLSHRSYFGRHERPPAAGLCDWTRPAVELERLVRALDFGHYENAFAVPKILHLGRVCLPGAAQVSDPTQGSEPGRLLEIEEDGWRVACGEDSSLRLTDFRCPLGNVLSPGDAAERLGLQVGDRIVGLEPAARERLDELARETTPAEAFWVRQLERLDSPEVPFRRPDRGATRDIALESLDLPLPARFRNTHASDPSSAAIAAFAAYIARMNGRSDFDLAFSDASFGDRVEGLGELFARHVPLRIDLDPSEEVGQVMDRVGRAIARVRERGGFLTDIVRRYPRIQQNAIVSSGGLSSVGVALTPDLDGFVPAGGVDCTWVVDPTGEQGRIVYDPSALTAESAAKLAHHFGIFLEGMADRSYPLSKVPLLDVESRRRILVDWNRTDVEHDRSKTIHALFEAQALRTPDRVAAVFEAEEITYAELDRRANQLAHHLGALGIGPDELVGIYLERSIEMLIAMLGILKAGGAYVPLDPTYPMDRIEYMIADSGASVVVSQGDLLEQVPASGAVMVALDRDAAEIAERPTQPPHVDLDASHLAYVIYTSGSTGKPKGVMVEHRNVVNFFVGMDQRIPHDPPGVWLAVTSLSFDISVLELLWTLTRGFKVVVHRDRQRTAEAGAVSTRPWRPLDFGLALWGSDAGPGPRKYELMLESAKFGDERGFRSVHTPERHFGAFGGPFPNPSVTSAAIAAVTSRIQIRASSCVLPLHHPVRVAEEWAVVDNLSGGRVGISFASGWQPNDFVIRPEAYADAKKKMFEGADAVKRLWRGEAVDFVNPNGQSIATRTLPRPVQAELPSWMTTAGNVETFRAAGEGGFNILTHLLGQTLEELAEKIKVYRRARATAGLDPQSGIVTCMLHTYVGEDDDRVRELVRQPMKDYLASAMKLVVGFAWSFPAFERPGGPNSKPEDVDLTSLTEEETDAILEFAFERYYETSGLFGTPEICARMVERVKAAGIDEVASLIDFGLPTEVALAGLEGLDRVRREANEQPTSTAVATGEDVADYSLPGQITAHGVTHLQCTPSHATMLLADPDARISLARVEHLMIGGEAFPVSLAAELEGVGCRNVTNMYGPTETTIWSSTETVHGRPESISIGRPIANTQLYILGANQEPLPVGVAGELLIGGEGVVRGYLNRPDLTAERFVPDPFSDSPHARLYRTGDLARWREDGTIDFLGRLDHQVKIRGYRIELGEIEARLSALPTIREAVVIAREDTPGDHRLVAYLIPETSSVPDETLRGALREQLPEFMLPSAFIFLERYPQTPNGKIDRKALPAPSEVGTRRQAEYKPPGNEVEALIASVWKEVLYVEQVGIDDNFFDLGGHSLLVVQAHRKLRERCEQKVTLTDLYRFPTVRALADHLASDGKEEEKQVEQSRARGEKRREALGRRRRRGRE